MCVAAGAVLLLFAGYQLWGTGWLQAAEQRSLRGELESAGLARATVPGELARGAGATPITEPATAPEYETGGAVGVLRIPAIGVDQVLVEGADRDQLKLGPGHYPHSPLPGYAGNASIAGHRTTYGAPFNRIDELAPGDAIEVETAYGRFTYRVTSQQIVEPTDVSVVDRTDDNRLTLTTCHPKYSAKERLIVTAALEGDPVDAPPHVGRAEPAALPGEDVAAPKPAPVAHLDGAGSSGLAAATWGSVGWGALLALTAAGWWFMYREGRRWTTWVGGAIPFLLVLFMFFGEVERVLPANY